MSEDRILEVLKASKFGNRTAEEESDLIQEYFVETDQWSRVRGGEVDIVYGAKGSGKSAIYSLIIKNEEKFFDDGIILVSGEQPQGNPVFQSVLDSPPSSELEFANLWKLYALSLIGATIRDYGIRNSHSERVVSALETLELIPREFTLAKALKYALDYLRRWRASIEGIETSVAVEPNTMAPVFSGKILFREPTLEQAKNGAVSVDELLESANTGLSIAGYKIWLLLDRLDVAFSKSDDVETLALRGLFKFYLDTKQLQSIRSKIFLRSDIWKRITEKGFREASHIERVITISWKDADLLKLATRRFASNLSILDHYKRNKAEVLASSDSQREFFYLICPEKVETGPNKPETFNWILGRTHDASGNVAPREIIDFLNSLRSEQISRIEGGRAKISETKLFEQIAFKDALPAVSKVRLEQTLYAEYPQHRAHIELLREQKATQTLSNLCRLWKSSKEEALLKLSQLEEVGFFEKKQDETWRVPFLYWAALDLVQGRAD